MSTKLCQNGNLPIVKKTAGGQSRAFLSWLCKSITILAYLCKIPRLVSRALKDFKPVAKYDCQLLRSLYPISSWHSPFFLDVVVCEIYKFEEGIVIWEDALGLRYLAHLAVVAFHCICRIDNVAYRLCVLEIL